MGKIKLKVLGISYSQTQSGAYALILAEEEGKRRIPIIIGGFEAQAIAIEMEGLKPPRPLTHDLFVNFADAYNINIIDVTINRLEEGIFYSEVTCDNGNSRIKIDARTSDSVALALRFNCPIFTTHEVLEKAGIELETERPDDREAGVSKSHVDEEERIEKFNKHSSDDLKKMLDDAIAKEDYEKASDIRDEIKRREEQ